MFGFGSDSENKSSATSNGAQTPAVSNQSEGEGSFFSSIFSGLQSFGSTIGDWASSAWGGIKSFFGFGGDSASKSPVDAVSGAAKTVLGGATGSGCGCCCCNGGTGGAGSVVSGMLSKVTDGKIGDGAKDAVGKAMNGTGPGSSILDNFTDGLKDAFSSACDFLSDLMPDCIKNIDWKGI